MRRATDRIRLLAGLGILLAISAAGVAVAIDTPANSRFPDGFFGLALAEPASYGEFERMEDGGAESVRYLMSWATIEAEPGSYSWETFDPVVASAAAYGMTVLPVVHGTPDWLAGSATVMPVHNERQREAWREFLQKAAARYGPGGTFWTEHQDYPEVPITSWQVWNEPNFFYFSTPVSPSDYADLVAVAREGLSAGDPDAEVVLAGLFGQPPQPEPKAMTAVDFLDDFYEDADLEDFDAVALHPYSAEAADMPAAIEGLRAVMAENGDGETDLWLTEIGWGDGTGTAFEKGPSGQSRELRIAYSLLERRGEELRIPRVYWFAWKDTGGCDFCDSTGLTTKYGVPKLAWETFGEFAER